MRSSCTIAPPTVLGYESAKYNYEKLLSGETTADEIMDDVRSQIKRLYNLPEGTGIVLTPSRYDAQYIPILVAKALNKEKDHLVNIINSKNEYGDCMIQAAGGQMFCKQLPFLEFLKATPG